MEPVLEKVTSFITRPGKTGLELLLFEHPQTGIQIPAGTVEAGEEPEIAALREAHEESGLTALFMSACLGSQDESLPPQQAVLLSAAPIYARPDPASFNWAHLRRGIQVNLLRSHQNFSQVSYMEYNQGKAPHWVSYQITGWVQSCELSKLRRRTFYQIECRQPTPTQWEVVTDYHTFHLFWAPIHCLPDIIPPQNEWPNWLLKSI